ncbi:MAG: hypothetical protein Q9157_006393 [Trypethelium eluteriae]
MVLIQLFVAFVVSITSTKAQNIIDVLSSYPSLSQVSSLIASYPQVSEQFNNSQGFTFLAPSGDAISTWLNTSSPSNSTIGATLKYHLLAVTFPSAAFGPSLPVFVATALNDTAYTNVTSGSWGQYGQYVEVNKDTRPVFISGNKSESHIEIPDIVCTNGIVHVIDNVLEIPSDILTEATAAHLDVFIDLLATDNFSIAEEVKSQPNITILAPNSDIAIATSDRTDFNNAYSNSTTLNMLFNYHIIENLIFSHHFQNGTSLTTKAGIKILVTVDETGDIWLNQAKVTGKDYIIANGAMHVIDDILQPYNISRPSLITTGNATVGNISKPSTNTAAPANPTPSSSSGLSGGGKVGIGVGVAVAGLAIIGAILLYYLKNQRRRRADNDKILGTEEVKITPELGDNGLHEFPQLDPIQPPREMELTQRHELGSP